MVRIEMLAVGKELLIGRTLNTNAHWIGGRLGKMGTMLKEVTTVDDDLKEISSSLLAILRRKPDFLVVVGGLGPTPDDMTLMGIAKGLKVEMRESPEALALIREHYAKLKMGRVELTPPRRKMAVLPTVGIPVRNEEGTAPGVRIVVGPTVVYSLPGVPAEMKGIFRRSVEPEIRRKVGKLYREYVRMKVEGVPESVMAPMISRELKTHPGAYVKSHPRGVKQGVSTVELDVAVVGADRAETQLEGQTIGEDLASMVRKSGGRVTYVGTKR